MNQNEKANEAKVDQTLPASGNIERGAGVAPGGSSRGEGQPSGTAHENVIRCNAKDTRRALLAPFELSLFGAYHAFADRDRLADARRHFDEVRSRLEAEDWRPVAGILPAIEALLSLSPYADVAGARSVLREFLAGATTGGDALQRGADSSDPLATLAGSLVSARAWLERLGWSRTGGTQLRDQIDAALALVPPAVRLGQSWVSRVTNADGPEISADGAGLADDKRARGLYRKFEVRRTDGSDAIGGKHHGCAYFVLDLDHDEHAKPALRAYAKSCRKQFPVLADDLDSLAGGNGLMKARTFGDGVPPGAEPALSVTFNGVRRDYDSSGAPTIPSACGLSGHVWRSSTALGPCVCGELTISRGASAKPAPHSDKFVALVERIRELTFWRPADTIDALRVRLACIAVAMTEPEFGPVKRESPTMRDRLDAASATGVQLEYLRAAVREAFGLPATSDDADLIETLFEAGNNPRFRAPDPAESRAAVAGELREDLSFILERSGYHGAATGVRRWMGARDRLRAFLEGAPPAAGSLLGPGAGLEESAPVVPLLALRRVITAARRNYLEPEELEASIELERFVDGAPAPSMADLKRAPGMGAIFEAVDVVIQRFHALERFVGDVTGRWRLSDGVESALGKLERLVEEEAAGRLAGAKSGDPAADLARAERLVDSWRGGERGVRILIAHHEGEKLVPVDEAFGLRAISLLERKIGELEESNEARLRESSRLKDELDKARAAVDAGSMMGIPIRAVGDMPPDGVALVRVEPCS